MLQVENVFHLQVIGEGNDTQLSLSWRTLDEKRKEEEFCEGCETGNLREMIEELVEKLVGVKKVVQEHLVKTKKRGILFRFTPRSKWEEGCKKWFKSGDEKTQGKYEGDIENGVPNGLGTMTFPRGIKWVGEFKDGVLIGQGSQTYPDGHKYVGEFQDGWRNGQGTFT